MPKYDFSALEKKYSKIWKDEGIYEPDLDKAKNPFYNLMMFPYPSAEGLHVGNMYAFTGSDVYGRMKRMQGYDVFEPIGLDGFGIHSENYALKIGAHPMEQSKVSEKNFYQQLEMIGNGFAWGAVLETYDPAYYRSTQWLFTEMWRAGLAYRRRASVNWCPQDKTVLADEQVVNGKCERCSSVVEKKELEQWFFRITKYAEKLLKNLENIDWSERVKIAQRNWIGRSEGALIKFQIPNSKFQIREIEVFTTRPDTLFGATYLAVSPELADEWFSAGWNAPDEVKKYVKDALLRRGNEEYGEKEKTGVFSGIYAINPATNEKTPVWISDYVLAGYGTGAIMAVPAHDERDFEFANKFHLPVRKVIEPPRIVPEPVPGQAVPDTKIVSECWEGEGELINSGKFDGMDSEKVRREITEFVGGKWETQYRLRDWLISRQRYWGVPIPMIFCETCAAKGKGGQPAPTGASGKDMPGWYAAPENDLPVELPYVKNFKPMGTGVSPLASVAEFYEVKCPACGGKARRETDVSDTFLDSSWYYIGYLAKQNSEFEIQNSEFRSRAKRWLPVDMYIGGVEHAVLHLLYVRFVAMAMKDMGYVGFEEPITKFRLHGLLVSEGAKMSKSKGNVVNPDEYIRRFGADAFRMYLMFLAPFEEGGDFRDEGILGPARFLERVWKLAEKVESGKLKAKSQTLERVVHQTVKKVTGDIESLHYNTAVSALMILLSELEKEGVAKEDFETFLKLLAPFAPFITEELYQRLSASSQRESAFRSIHSEPWPEYDPKKIIEDTFTLVVQVNGKVRGQIEVSRGISEKEAREKALTLPTVKKFIAGKSVRRAVYVSGRLINFVTE